jgi:hypothetical protein
MVLMSAGSNRSRSSIIHPIGIRVRTLYRAPYSRFELTVAQSAVVAQAGDEQRE